MATQTLCQLIILLGIIITAIGGYGSYHYGNKEQAVRDRKADELKSQIGSLEAMTSRISEQNDLIFKSTIGNDTDWIDLEMKHVPPGVTDYLLLLFTSDTGRISGKVRIKGASEEASFSTTANNRIPIALRNLWLPEANQYKTPTVMQFKITEKTAPTSLLSIFTQGWIDTLGTEPH